MVIIIVIIIRIFKPPKIHIFLKYSKVKEKINDIYNNNNNNNNDNNNENNNYIGRGYTSPFTHR